MQRRLLRLRGSQSYAAVESEHQRRDEEQMKNGVVRSRIVCALDSVEGFLVIYAFVLVAFISSYFHAGAY